MSGAGARWRGLPLWARDGLLAVALTLAGQAELLLADGPVARLPWQMAAFAVMTGSLVLRRLRPLTAAVAVAAGLAFQTVLGNAPAVSGFVAVLVVTYSVAQYADRRRDALAGLVAVLVAIELYAFVGDDVRVADEIANAAIPIVVWVFARLARERLDRAVAAEREVMAARERAREEELARASALAAERRRIAREMHDVVGHAVTLMLLHADAAQAGLGGREPATVRALDVVLASGRAALDDLRRLLRVLRDDTGGGPADGRPGSLAAVEELVAAARSAGHPAVLAVDGCPRPLPAAVEATAYRIVQESVTNAMRHAPGARIDVRVHYADQALEVEIADDGGVAPTPRTGAGFGLAGIRERVALFDGRVEAGPRDDGRGWRTRAVLPVPATEHAPA
ncbi:sensor histidine kinase [Blastococcus saxobsidens]|uniref:histidine kinase n=1 Tax=Blastococcus saxobsidens (strain DD2) TaxID=1146883 RepID=H6RVB8_BLASD|nr:histidine kinase [Blastococcus saxobsidens]CCG01995.1 two-component system sensor kinase [Blastococcus saxobsidens DD2]